MVKIILKHKSRIHNEQSIGQETECEVEFMGSHHKAVFRPYEIKTFLIEPDGSWNEVNLIEEYV